MNFRGKSAAGDLSGFLDQGSHFEGELRFEQSFRIDGKVTGKIRSEGDLVVGEKGEIDGEVRVGRLFVSGVVRGDIRATKRLSIHARGRVEGEVHAPALVIDEGGVLEGRCAMSAPGAEGAEGEATPHKAGGTAHAEPLPAKVVGRIASVAKER
jgi:cytoskeletal protein CcmA (bactofilin family)